MNGKNPQKTPGEVPPALVGHLLELHAAVEGMFEAIACGDAAAFAGAGYAVIRLATEVANHVGVSLAHVDGPSPAARNFRSAGSAETAYPGWRY